MSHEKATKYECDGTEKKRPKENRINSQLTPFRMDDEAKMSAGQGRKVNERLYSFGFFFSKIMF